MVPVSFGVVLLLTFETSPGEVSVGAAKTVRAAEAATMSVVKETIVIKTACCMIVVKRSGMQGEREGLQIPIPVLRESPAYLIATQPFIMTSALRLKHPQALP